jgi:uncharacterized membrane protein
MAPTGREIVSTVGSAGGAVSVQAKSECRQQQTSIGGFLGVAARLSGAARLVHCLGTGSSDRAATG